VITQVPAIISAMVAVFSAAPALTSVGVHDGYPMSNEGEVARIIVGGTDIPLEPGAIVDNLGDMLPDLISTDVITITCLIETWSGSPDDIAGQRVAAFTILDAVRTLLRPTTVGVTLALPALAWARIGRIVMTQTQSTAGCKVLLNLSIDIQTKASV
jgi:hypothetical protein